MNRPFLRVYATLAVVILVVTVSLQWLARRHYERQLEAWMTESERVAERLGVAHVVANVVAVAAAGRVAG